jgi:protein tyrosine phosphatase (PTP) superfamily phosphohydrolase (DUF442 family)
VFDKAGFEACAALQLFRARKGLIAKDNVKSVTEKAVKEANNHGVVLSKETIAGLAREAKEMGVIEANMAATDFAGMRVLPHAVEESLTSYHWLKFLFQVGEVGVFDAGQIQSYHVDALKKANIKAIINMRQGALDENGGVIGSTQEPVNLLNLEFSPLSKGLTDADAFLADPAKAALVIDANRPASWACSFETADPAKYEACVSGDKNFETSNALEWGDAVGQNAFDEGKDLKEAGIPYYHLPVGAMQQPAPMPFNAATFEKYPATHQPPNHSISSSCFV